VRELFLGLGLSSARQSGKREGWRGMVGVFIVFSPKIAVGRKCTRRLRVYARRLRATQVFQPGNSTRTLRAKRSGVSGPIPGVSGLGRETSIFALLNCFVAHKYLSRFSWALVSSQHLWIKSLLIVRRPYTQISKIKSNSMSMLEHRLFHFLFEGPYVITWFTYTYSSPAHMLNYTIKYTCVLSLFTKTHLGA